jgi:hypothetical protein
MTAKSFCGLAATIFMVVALVQLTRAGLGWSLSIDGYDIPVWASWIAFVIASGLSFLGFRAAGRN